MSEVRKGSKGKDIIPVFAKDGVKSVDINGPVSSRPSETTSTGGSGYDPQWGASINNMPVINEKVARKIYLFLIFIRCTNAFGMGLVSGSRINILYKVINDGGGRKQHVHTQDMLTKVTVLTSVLQFAVSPFVGRYMDSVGRSAAMFLALLMAGGAKLVLGLSVAVRSTFTADHLGTIISKLHMSRDGGKFTIMIKQTIIAFLSKVRARFKGSETFRNILATMTLAAYVTNQLVVNGCSAPIFFDATRALTGDCYGYGSSVGIQRSLSIMRYALAASVLGTYAGTTIVPYSSWPEVAYILFGAFQVISGHFVCRKLKQLETQIRGKQRTPSMGTCREFATCSEGSDNSVKANQRSFQDRIDHMGLIVGVKTGVTASLQEFRSKISSTLSAIHNSNPAVVFRSSRILTLIAVYKVARTLPWYVNTLDTIYIRANVAPRWGGHEDSRMWRYWLICGFLGSFLDIPFMDLDSKRGPLGKSGLSLFDRVRVFGKTIILSIWSDGCRIFSDVEELFTKKKRQGEELRMVSPMNRTSSMLREGSIPLEVGKLGSVRDMDENLPVEKQDSLKNVEPTDFFYIVQLDHLLDLCTYLNFAFCTNPELLFLQPVFSMMQSGSTAINRLLQKEAARMDINQGTLNAAETALLFVPNLVCPWVFSELYRYYSKKFEKHAKLSFMYNPYLISSWLQLILIGVVVPYIWREMGKSKKKRHRT